MLVNISLKLPEEILARLNILAKETGRTKTYYATQAIIQQIGDLEDYYLAEKSWQEFVAGDRKTYTTDELIAELEL